MKSECDVNTNLNTSWLANKVVWAVYLFLIVAFRLMMASFTDDGSLAWSVTNLTHALVTFLFFHWVKSSPVSDLTGDQGKYKGLTFWEQIDDQLQFTSTRKLMTLVPCVLLLITVYSISEASPLFFVNIAATAVILIAKLPVMHKVRLLEIGKY